MSQSDGTLINDPLDLRTIELDSLMEDGLWHCEKKANLIKETKNEKVYELDGIIMTLRHIGGNHDE